MRVGGQLEPDDLPPRPGIEVVRELKNLAARRMQARHDKAPMPRVPRRLTVNPLLVGLRKRFELQYREALHPSAQLRDEVFRIAAKRAYASLGNKPLPAVPPRLRLAPLVALRKRAETEVVRIVRRNLMIQHFRKHGSFPDASAGGKPAAAGRAVADAREYLRLHANVPAVALPPATAASAVPRSTPRSQGPSESPVPDAGSPPQQQSVRSRWVFVVIAILGIWFVLASCGDSRSFDGPGIHCRDGWISHSSGSRGTCSHHGGIG